MFYRRFSIPALLAAAALFLIAACGVSAYQEATREATVPDEMATAAEVAALDQEVAALKAQLQQIAGSGVTVWSAAITPAASGGNAVWTRASGETAAGAISGETGDADFRLLKILRTGATNDLTIVTPGPAAGFADQTLRIGNNYLTFQSSIGSATYSSDADQTVWSFVGDYASWYTSGVAHQVAVLSPINPVNLLPDPIPAVTALPDHLLGYDDGVNQAPLSLLDNRYRQQVPADTPKVFSFPTSPAPAAGDTVILLHPDAVPRYFTGDVKEGQVTLREMIVNLNIPGGRISHLRGYSPTYTGRAAAAFRGKVFAIIQRNPASRPTKLHYQGASYSISQSFVPGEQGFYEVSGLGYAQLSVGTQHRYAFTLADGTKYPPDRQYQPDTYTFNGSSWELTPGSVSRWAEADNADKIPLNKLPAAATQVVHSGTGTGISVASSGQTATQRVAFTGFTPTFDLDDNDKRRGVITVRAKLRFDRRTVNTAGFNDDTQNPLLTGAIDGLVFARAVKSAAAYSATADSGEKIGAAVLRNGSATLGSLSLYVARDAHNALGYYLSYTGKSGSIGFDIALADLEVGFIPDDAPRSIQGAKLATWTAQTTTPTSTRISGAGRKPNWTIEPSPPGTGSIFTQPGHLPSNQQNRIRVDQYTPTDQCFGWLFIAKTGGTEVDRVVVPFSPSGISDITKALSASAHPGSAYTRMNLGGGQFLLITYHSILNDGQDRINIGPQPTGFDDTGRANAWSSWPANLTVELYEAVID